jgi:glycosyltransferase involved in cell wall biosynthesis
MSRPFVSVVTPTYNRRRFLPILIHLYQQQTYPADLRELIILDDSPTSNEDIIPKNDNSIRYIYEPIKIPLGEKRNKLNHLAKGDIIVCFDDDDYHYPERITHSVMKLNQEKTDIAGCTLIDIYFSDINKIYQFGPYGRNHGTNGTFAYRRKYFENHKYDNLKNAQEEPDFTNNWTEKMANLDESKTILCISHDSNTYDKRNLLKQNQPKREIGIKLNKKIKDKKYLEFLKEISEEMKQQNIII